MEVGDCKDPWKLDEFLRTCPKLAHPTGSCCISLASPLGHYTTDHNQQECHNCWSGELRTGMAVKCPRIPVLHGVSTCNYLQALVVKQGNAARKDAGCFAIRHFWCVSGHVALLDAISWMFLLHPFMSLGVHHDTHTHRYIYIYICVCVCELELFHVFVQPYACLKKWH